MIVVRLRLPTAILSPNSRAHWAVKSRAAKALRLTAYAQTLAVPIPHAFGNGQGPLHVRCRWFLPDRRRRDADNLLASMKSAFDGIADALEIDDAGFVHWPGVMEVDPSAPRVEVEISDRLQGFATAN